ncbi:hypothetical protein BB560_000391 [Smittium megazygosporum]|uniref:Uncharacterized protein n=1 Tax=Smittium megazygosporum TaxID=133381 RepID=A0A2T9ZKI1_9FUNG|nr:hypothetical protein BB560_000391 [Smittium megazygosporum]
MRYFARFIVVCLLLNDDETAKKLTNTLAELVEEYFITFNPIDKSEWRLVIKEIQIFTKGKSTLTPCDENGNLHSLSMSLENMPEMKFMQDIKPVLSRAVIVGNTYKQIKFSEMTLDMFKIVHTLEYEFVESSIIKQKGRPQIKTTEQPISSENQDKIENSEKVGSNTVKTESKDEKNRDEESSQKEDKKEPAERRRLLNPQKYLFFRANFSNLISSISSAFKEVDRVSCMFVYISAEGYFSNEDSGYANYKSGIITASKKHVDKQAKNALAIEEVEKKSKVIELEPHCFYPADVISFTRKPMFMVVDSNNSTTFKDIPDLFNQPLVILMSPTQVPEKINYNAMASGNLYTTFLYSLVVGLCTVLEISVISATKWEMLQISMLKIQDLIYEGVLANVNDEGVLTLFGDLFLRRYMINHLACVEILKLHRLFTLPENLPTSVPKLEIQETVSTKISEIVLSAVKEIGINVHYFLSPNTQNAE